jgi:hypothetical protein
MTKEFPNAILLLDRYFLTIPALERLDAFNAGGGGLRAIIMAKSNAIAYEEPKARKTGIKGRPPIKGRTVKLAELFDKEADKFEQSDVTLYGKKITVRYMVKDLLWGRELYRKMRFVLVEFSGRRVIIASTDTKIEPTVIVELYAKRFSIECTFKSMKHDVAAFSNRFWSQYLPKLNRYEKSGAPDRATKVKSDHGRRLVRKALDATEGYVFCGVVATGILQMLSLTHIKGWSGFKLRYLRTPSKTAESEATVAEYLRRNILLHLTHAADSTISKIIFEKMDTVVYNYEDLMAG